MKQIIFILLTSIILSCNQNHKKDDFLGIWDVVSSTDFETGEVELLEKEFVEFKLDSLYLISDFEVNQVFAWRIEGDSIFLDEDGSVYIKELTANNLVVEYDFFGKIQLVLNKRK
ncbi:hypothetical protein L3X39_08470 [Sabulilitoribacter multivorans]|uniref:Lipocalin-like domain-containing protein n=1 Tax=Flaviramulus multivorans TaxID=1304750 RepID=A0ABS9IJA1_9FLAO|nr:hypothetical protein [Flaviramulus multivorans]MCF7560670.1 hypothetical protein [Flaviramulus multivorans]